ncbi:MAG: carboxylating nicotinate-nucleotide diphosphorylase [Ignavibacteria bacterium]|nr:carboxylating nicotinate-nucleotide diphosphorylase [Ignavibacteria bacterium]
MFPFRQITRININRLPKSMTYYLNEDRADEDVTTKLTVPEDMVSKANIEAQSPLVFAGGEIINCIFEECQVELLVKDGDAINSGDIIANLEGNARYMLSRERVMLNLIQRLSGIATAARKYSDVTKPFGVDILDTRKTTPGLRRFEKYAVNVGGAKNHRFDLKSAILIKDNHIAAAGGIKNVVENIKNSKHSKLFTELEVDTKEQLIEALELGLRAFLLDNMSPELIKECVAIIRSQPNGENIFVEASGGVTYDTLADYAATGINAISVGALTHRIVSADIHMNFI